jgi:hypothetical protein
MSGEYRAKGIDTMAMTFEQIVETIKQFPAEQQEMLVDLIQSWKVRSETRTSSNT